MTESPSETPVETASEEALETRAAFFAELVGSTEWSAEHRTIKIHIGRDQWVAAHTAVKEHLPFFSWLAAIDWDTEVEVGDPPEDEDLTPHYEVLSRVSDVTAGEAIHLSVELPKDDAVLDTLTPVFGGAEWHEREAHEMYGIDFKGHPNLIKLYLPDGFHGHPLRKSYPLLSREVKPWPGTVDVEAMPSTENVEAEAGEDES